MGFLGVYRAVYDYAPASDAELSISDGDLLFVLEKSTDDDWWRAKKKATEDDEEEPEGLIPNNYIEEAQPIHQARALYDYSRQTDEELSFAEHAVLDVYDEHDPDWTLVGLDGEFGFAPANYIEAADAAPTKPPRPQSGDLQEQTRSPTASISSPATQTPAATLAGIIAQKTGPSASDSSRSAPQYTPEASDEEQPAPSLPQRPPSGPTSPPTAQQRSPQTPEPRGVMASPPPPEAENGLASPRGYHLYNIHELISHMGRNKKMPTTLGINVAKGIIMIAPEKSRDGPQQQWTAEKLTHYSLEGKHVFMELVRPSKSIDFHAGAKDTAQEICSALGELAGAARAEGLKEVWAAGAGSSGQKKGHMLYEFMAQGDDEVTVAAEDEVIVLDDTQSEEWWMVRRLKNGKEGVVPSTYVEVTGMVATAPDTGLEAARSTVEQNRRDEERLARAALEKDEKERSRANNKKGKKEDKKKSQEPADLPKARKVRVWTDRSGEFKVDAQFLGLKDGKLHLHKTNGVKIAVPANRMSVEDLEYVEAATGLSLDEDKPLSDIQRRSTQRRQERDRQSSLANSRSGAAVEQSKPKYDWFDFFLQCGVNPQICERYSATFDRDQMGEENMEDIDSTLLRTLGLKEGDVLRVMKFLDAKFARSRDKRQQDGEDATNGDGLFSGPGGALRNNTRKGRPAPAVQSNDTVDPRAFEQDSIRKDTPVDSTRTPIASAPPPTRRTTSGFDDDAWDNKPTKQSATSPRATSPGDIGPPPPPKPAPTGALGDLSLLSPPLQPSPASQPPIQPQPTQSPPPSQPYQQQPPPMQAQPTGANRQFFDQLGAPGSAPLQGSQTSLPRQRPQAPPQQSTQNSAIPPPPRSISAPHNNQPSAFGPPPLQPQSTGYQAQISAPGQSLNDLNQQRYQSQFGQQPMQPQQTGYNGYSQGPNGFNSYQQPPHLQQQAPQQYPAPTGMYPQNPQQFPHHLQQPFINGQQTGSPFADPPRQPFQPLQPQQTGYNNFASPQPQMPQQTGINSFLQPALQPQPTGFGNSQSFGINGFGPQHQNNLQSPPPVPPLPQQQTGLQPLRAQKTGPPPPVRFGSQAAQKLTPQPTGRANLANATPHNPFGF
ncbi:MAG: cytoskeletal protein binding protein [Chrysothrix sp. TS-e1954]|nr:MAG: cytoskeletal protein binding protein [Chrysothrix sp. TS-e1954]